MGNARHLLFLFSFLLPLLADLAPPAGLADLEAGATVEVLPDMVEGGRVKVA